MLAHLLFCRGQPSNEIQSTNYYVRNYQRNMQNKPNFQKSQMNVKSCNTKDYQDFIPLAGQENKPNSNPIKPNLQEGKIDAKHVFTKDYRKNDDFVVRINKPNFRNGQNERKLIYNKGLQKERCFRSQKTKPIQTQSKPVLSAVEWANFTYPHRGKNRSPMPDVRGQIVSIATALPTYCLERNPAMLPCWCSILNS
jgi:hypothetical protein